jgi:endonuclease/exonuclease/phosphatase family metal-dependent hydrolase
VIRALSYNVHACVGVDGRRSVERIGRVLEAGAADVIALQEVMCGAPADRNGQDQAAELAGRLDMTLLRAPTLHRPGGPFGNALLTRNAPSWARVHPLPAAAGEPRNAIEAELQTPVGPLRLFATHLGLPPGERARQAAALAELARAALRQQPAGGVLVMGDVNAWRARGSVASLERLLGPTRTPRTFPARFPVLALDRMWLRSAALRLRVDAHRSAESTIASDHLPLLGELSPRESPA